MSHREDLLDGAVACLREKGYAQTTARDIVAASGTNLASIGYHYGSLKALLNAAVLKALDDFGEQMAQAMSAVDRCDRIRAGRSSCCAGRRIQAGRARQARLAMAAGPAPESSSRTRTSSP